MPKRKPVYNIIVIDKEKKEYTRYRPGSTRPEHEQEIPPVPAPLELITETYSGPISTDFQIPSGSIFSDDPIWTSHTEDPPTGTSQPGLIQVPNESIFNTFFDDGDEP